MSFSFLRHLDQHVGTRPEKVAFTDLEREVTYSELSIISGRIGNALTDLGVGAGDRVAYLGRTRLEFFLTFFGAARIGAVLSPLNWRLKPEAIARLIHGSGAAVAIVEPDFVHLLPRGQHVIELGPQFENWCNSAATRDPAPSPDAGDIVAQTFTSGTTALPKGVQLSHANFEGAFAMHSVLRMDSDSRIMAAMPVHHVGGNVWGMFAFYTGGTTVLYHRENFDPIEVASTIQNEGITHVAFAPVMISAVAEAAATHGFDLSAIMGMVYGSQPITRKALHRIHECIDVPLFTVYGMTETTGAGTALLPEDHRRPDLLGSVGRPVPGIEVTVADLLTDRALPPGQRGEVRMRGQACTTGYQANPEADKNLYREGWLCTGDIGYMDQDGYLFLVDRANDMVITGGENVYPREVEAVLIEHPDIEDVAVVGIPHEKWGEAVTAFVVTRPDASLDPADVLKWSRERLAGFQRPQEVHFIDVLPRNSSGKVLRRQLRAGTG